ncbi:MAG: hypothetical protein AAFO69_19305, partial [Bacteroidota bacterium]
MRGIGQTVWALTQNGKLARIEDDETTIYELNELKESVSHDFIIFDDQLLVATNDGLFLYNFTDESFVSKGVVKNTKYIEINTIFQDHGESEWFWLGTSNGLMTLDANAKQAKVMDNFPTDVEISSIDKDDLNTLWVGSKNSGLFEVDLKKELIVSITHFNRWKGFESDQVGKVYVDEENEVWVGTFGRGLVQLNRAYFHHYELTKNIGVEGIHSIANYKQDQLILGTESGLVQVFSQSMSDSLNFKLLDFTKDYVFQSIQVEGDIVWAGTKKNGVLKINLQTNSLERVFLNPLDPVENYLIRDIKLDRDGHLWIAAAGNGVYHLTKEGELIAHYNTRSGFYHNEIFSIFPDQGGNIWFGSHATGLALLTKDKQMKFLSKDEVFPAFDINAITQDESGVIWITTEGSGIYSFDGENFKQYTENDGMLSNYCNATVIDNLGQVWVGHRLGLSLIQPTLGLINVFNHPSDLGETEAELNSVCKDNKGNVYFGNPHGMTKVNLPHFNFRERTRETHIKDIRLFFQSADLLQFTEQVKLDNVLPADLKFP